MAENQLPLDPERRKEKEFFEELYPREEPETTRSSMTPRGNRKPIGSGGSEKERQYKRRSKKRRFPKILETRAMQDIYDRDTNIHEGRDKIIDESKGLEGQEKIDKLKEAARTKLRGQEFMDDLISKIEGGFQTVVDTAATDDPDSYLDDAARTGLTTLQFIGNVANTPGISHTLRFLDTPFWVARQAAGGALEHGLGVDPRYGHAAVGVGEFFVGGKALTGVAKKAKHAHQMSGLSRAYKKGTQFIPDTAILPRQRELGLQMMSRIDDGPDYMQRTLFNLEDYLGPIDPSSKRAAQLFNDLIARKSGYESMSIFKREVLNKWPKKNQEQLFRELWHNRKYEGYIEHLTSKAEHMDWYWNMKGLDRHSVGNVRILYNDNLKNLKDTVEKIVHGVKLPNGTFRPGLGWKSPNLKDRIIVSFEDPMRKTKKLFSRQNPGDIILKRAGSDEIIGNLGQYLDLLYPQSPVAKKAFKEGVKKLGIKPNEFRKKILEERINIILDNTDTLPKNPTARKRWIKQNTDDDMTALANKYEFLQTPKAIRKQIETDPGISAQALQDRTKTPKGPFGNVTKTEQFNPNNPQFKGD